MINNSNESKIQNHLQCTEIKSMPKKVSLRKKAFTMVEIAIAITVVISLMVGFIFTPMRLLDKPNELNAIQDLKMVRDAVIAINIEKPLVNIGTVADDTQIMKDDTNALDTTKLANRLNSFTGPGLKIVGDTTGTLQFADTSKDPWGNQYVLALLKDTTTSKFIGVQIMSHGADGTTVSEKDLVMKLTYDATGVLTVDNGNMMID